MPAHGNGEDVETFSPPGPLTTPSPASGGRGERARRSGSRGRLRRRILLALPVVLVLSFGTGWYLLRSGSPGASNRPASALVPAGTSAQPTLQLGLRFTPTISGVIATAVLPGASLARRVDLWNDQGRLLAAVPTTRGPDGSAVARFTPAVPVAAGTIYVISYSPADRRALSSGTNAVAAADRSVRIISAVFATGSGFPAQAAPQANVPFVFAVTAAGARPTTTKSATAGASGAPGATRTGSSTSTGSPGHNCAAAPHVCGYPDSSNTGPTSGLTRVSDGGKGAGWHVDSSGDLVVTSNGAVLKGLDIPFSVDVQASGVTIQGCRIRTGGDGFGIALRHTRNVTISHNEIFSPDAGADRLMVGIKDIYSDSAGTRVLGNDIWHTSTGVQIYQGLIQDNYIHSMGYKSGDHLNGITSNGGISALLTIRHNTVFNDHDQTDAISLFEDFGVESNRVIDNNLVAGGGYTIYGGQNAGGPTSHDVTITNNRFSRLYFSNGGGYGPVAAFEPSGPGNVWSGNIWDDTGRPVTF